MNYTDHALRKQIAYKQRTANHLLDQVESFRPVGDESRREDDLFDAFCYGIALTLGDAGGF